jgi:hypothetical protein
MSKLTGLNREATSQEPSIGLLTLNIASYPATHCLQFYLLRETKRELLYAQGNEQAEPVSSRAVAHAVAACEASSYFHE